MPLVLVDGQEIEIAQDEQLNGIQAARRVGVEIPHYCWHAGLSVVASCRMCLVETGRRDAGTGEISMVPKLVPACQTPATDGTVFVTDSDKVKQARAMVEEDLLLRHPIDCPICDKAGECLLQDYHFEHGRDQRRADIKPFTSRRRTMGDTVTLFVDRCVMCSRCVRFCREVTGTSELMVVNRGAHEEIDVFPGFPLDNKLSGNVVDLCPVGALGDRDFLYQQRVWFMRRHEHVCAGCSTGCSIYVEENQDRIYRLKPRENPHVNTWWMCDEGRYGWKYVHDENRRTLPEAVDEEGVRNLEGSELLREIDGLFAPSRRLGAVLSPFLTLEEAWLLGHWLRERDPEALLVAGPVPVSEGGDETFPTGFTIRAEKCPNRLGIAWVLEQLGGRQSSWQSLLEQDAESLDALWITGGYPDPWHASRQVADLPEGCRLQVQDLFASPLWERAILRVPGTAYPERSGSFVNAQGWLQSFEWAIRPPAGAWNEGQLVWRLAGRKGLYKPEVVRRELAGQSPGWEEAEGGEVPPTGMAFLDPDAFPHGEEVVDMRQEAVGS